MLEGPVSKMATESLEFRVLGPVEAGSPGQRIGIGHARQQAVLAVLILDLGRVVPTEQLIDRIWGDDPPATVRNVIYSYVARLKAAIADAADPATALVRRSGGYVLDAAPGQCDLHRFRTMVAGAATADDDEQAGAQLRSAVKLWRGPALAGLSGGWLDGMRDALELERRTALMDLNDIALRQGRHSGLIGELSEAATTQPADERLIGQLMLALYRSGRQADALRWFEQTRRRLADEFGADPGPELQALHRQILRLDPALADPRTVAAVSRAGGRDRLEPAVSARAAQHTADTGPADTGPADTGTADTGTADTGTTGKGTVPRELPADIPAFTGRSAELAELDRLLVSPAGDLSSAVVISAVSGTAGVGKTALAVRWAHRAVSHFPDGQLYVNLRGYDPGQPVLAGHALAGFLRSLGLPGPDIPTELEERASRYRTLMSGRRMLVVLDNAGGSEQVRPLLPGAPGCRVLVTSRDALAGLVAIDGARRLDLDLLPPQEAIALLRTLIGARVDTDSGAAALLAAQCARLPLALRVAAELAASRPMSALTELAEELASLQRRLELLDAGGDPRAAVRAVFSWSYRSLDATAGTMFRLLGTEPGPDLDSYAAAALTGITQQQARRALSTLARAHLIQPAGPGRYGMHDLLRAYARDLAAEHDSEDQQHAALTRLFDHYLYTTASAVGTLFPAERSSRPVIPQPATDAPSLPDPATARAWLDAHLASLTSAMAHVCANGWPSHATRLVPFLFRYLDTGDHHTEAVAILGHARNAARLAGDHAAEATALITLSAVVSQQGHLHQAVEFLWQAVDLAREADNLLVEARALANVGMVESRQGCLDQSNLHLRQGLSLLRQAGNATGQARTLIVIGDNERLQGRYPAAEDHYREALAVADEAGDQDSTAHTLEKLGVLELRLGRPTQASDLLHRAGALYRETGDRSCEASAVVNLGRVALQEGRYQEAADLAQRGLAYLRDAGVPSKEIEALNSIGDIYLATGQPGPARTQYAQALSLVIQTVDPFGQACAHSGLGSSYLASGDLARARRHWQQALDLYTRLGAPEADEIRAKLGAGHAPEVARHGTSG
jgi:DNA-binding SARP family transcriptional activator/Tfp pilus assembly protein PilF